MMKLMADQQKQMIVSMGQFLGEEVLHVMRGMERTEFGRGDSRRREARSAVLAGRAPTRAGPVSEGTYKDAEPVEIKLGLLRIGDITIGAVNAEIVFNPIAERQAEKEVAVRADDDGRRH